MQKFCHVHLLGSKLGNPRFHTWGNDGIDVSVILFYMLMHQGEQMRDFVPHLFVVCRRW